MTFCAYTQFKSTFTNIKSYNGSVMQEIVKTRGLDHKLSSPPIPWPDQDAKCAPGLWAEKFYRGRTLEIDTLI